MQIYLAVRGEISTSSRATSYHREPQEIVFGELFHVLKIYPYCLAPPPLDLW